MPTAIAPAAPAPAPSPSPASAPKPAASPTPAPAPKTAAPPATDPAPGDTDQPDNAFAALDAKIFGRREPAVPSEEEGDPAAPKPQEGGEQKTDVDPKAAEVSPGTKPADTKIDSKGPTWYRDAVGKANSEVETIRSTLAEREAKIAEYEAKGGETTAVTERLAAVEKERDEALAEARGLKQEMSPEFKEKYEKPFERAATEAKRFFEQLPITLEDGTTRRANWEHDFALLYALPEVEAADKAEELFGKHAGRVMSRYDELHRLSNISSEARENEKAQWKQTQTAREAAAVQQREASAAAIAKAESHFKEKHPELYADDPKDPDGNALMKNEAALLAKQPKSLAEYASRQARIKLQAIAFPRAAARIRQLTERVAELEAAQENAGALEPGNTKRKAGAVAAVPEEDFLASLKQLR